MPSLRVNVDGLDFSNPFVIGSGPPSTNAKIMSKAFSAGWGGVVAKTTSLTDTEVINVQPRYGKLKAGGGIVGFENIELISDADFEDWERWYRETKDAHPDGILIGSIMESYEKGRWQELAGRCIEAGCDALELNFSCPHGHPEKGMGAAMGQDPKRVEIVTRWVVEAAAGRPVWAKMTPNITDITVPALGAQAGGAVGVSAINTILCCIGINQRTLKPMPTVQGESTFGGYSYVAVKPIALRMVAELATALPGFSISGIGGMTNSWDAAEFILMGANTVQSCTGPMLQGFDMVTELQEGLLAVMEKHGFETIEDMRGHCLPSLSTHHHLVELQAEARARKAEAKRFRDEEWGEQDIKAGTNHLVSD